MVFEVFIAAIFTLWREHEMLRKVPKIKGFQATRKYIF